MANKRHKSQSVVAWLLASVLAVLPLLTVSVEPARAAAETTTPTKQEVSLADLSQQREGLQAEAARLREKVQMYADSVNEQQQKKNDLQQQIALKQQEISVTGQMIDSVDKTISIKQMEIATQQMEITKQQAVIEGRFQQLRQRLRAISKSGNLSTLQMVLSTQDYTDFLIRSKVAERISESDQQAMNALEAQLTGLSDQKAVLQQEKQALDEQRKPIVQLQTEQSQQKQELAVLYSEVNQVVNRLNADLNYYNQSLAQVQAQQSQLQAKINEAMLANVASGVFQSGTMYWPVPGGLVITSSFKFRWGRWHRGIDIACYGDAEGLPIVAAAPGKVIYTCTDGNGDGYGNYLMIDHGLDSRGVRIVTLYAHCLRLLASKGDTVLSGQVIAQVGNTGNSDGAHLHFEVRENGTAVDPVSRGYVSANGITVLA